jgi:parallel beta-helix repeat protein
MRIGRRASLLGLTAVAMVATTPFLVATGSGQTRMKRVALSCGSTVTTSVTLTANMVCAGSDGLDVGANGVVINLNGHLIQGDGTHIGVFDVSHTAVVVENGVVNNFAYGVEFGAGGTVQNVRSENDSQYAIFAAGNNAVINADYALSSGTGILVESNGAKVTGNWVEENTSFGIFVLGATGVSVLNNKATNNSSQGIAVADSTGLVSGNIADGNGNDGILVNNPGLGVTSGLIASNNRAAFNGNYGIRSTAGGSTDGGGNVVQDNTAECLDIICHEVSN